MWVFVTDSETFCVGKGKMENGNESMNLEISKFEVDETFWELHLQMQFQPLYNYAPQLVHCCLTRIKCSNSAFIT